MPIEKWSENLVVVHLSDEPLFGEDLRTLETGGQCRYAVLDFGAITLLNSASLAQLVFLRNRLLSRGGRLVLCNIPTPIWGIFLITGLDRLFQYSDSVSTSLATLQMEGLGVRG